MEADNRRARETEEASRWWMRLGTRPPHEVSQEDREQFTRWLRESPLHVAEMLHVAHVHHSLERFKLWKEIPLVKAESDRTVVPIGAQVDSGRWESEAASRTGKIKRLALAATVAVVLLAIPLLLPKFRGQIIDTERGERREVVLSDGSIVQVDPQTHLRVKFEKNVRHVYLERGRALFHVAKNPDRPFLVEADDIVVRAVGTAFGVERKNQNVIVTVSEGKVAVLSPNLSRELEGPSAGTDARKYPRSGQGVGLSGKPSSQEEEPGAPVLLTSGQQLTVPDAGSASPVRKVDTNRELAWAEGRLVFDSAPLSEVIEEFNRYNRVQLRLNGAGLSNRPVSGVFQASDPETLVAFIRAGASVSINREDAQQILISPSDAP